MVGFFSRPWTDTLCNEWPSRVKISPISPIWMCLQSPSCADSSCCGPSVCCVSDRFFSLAGQLNRLTPRRPHTRRYKGQRAMIGSVCARTPTLFTVCFSVWLLNGYWDRLLPWPLNFLSSFKAGKQQKNVFLVFSITSDIKIILIMLNTHF